MIKKAIRKWLVPSYIRDMTEFRRIKQTYAGDMAELRLLLDELDTARKSVMGDGKDIEIYGPVVFLGSLNACNVKLEPTIKPTINLSKFDMDSMLRLYGSNVQVTNCVMSSVEKAVHLREKKDK